MKVSEVQKEDGLALAQVINALKVAKFDGLSTRDMDALLVGRQWLQGVAKQIAEQLKEPQQSAPMKIKKMGKIKK